MYNAHFFAQTRPDFTVIKLLMTRFVLLLKNVFNAHVFAKKIMRPGFTVIKKFDDKILYSCSKTYYQYVISNKCNVLIGDFGVK